MYQLNDLVGTQIKDTVIDSYKSSRWKFFPWNSLWVLIVQFVIVGILSGLLVRLFTPKRPPTPEYH